eukprot:9705794-Lingulodinium_polyedra.AAC.1
MACWGVRNCPERPMDTKCLSKHKHDLGRTEHPPSGAPSPNLAPANAGGPLDPHCPAALAKLTP